MGRGFSSIGRPDKTHAEFAHAFSHAMDSRILTVDGYTLEKYQKGHQFIKLYPSSLPSCSCSLLAKAVEWVGGYHRWKNDGVMPMAEASASSETYGTMGTVRHTISQRYVGLSGKIIGNWSCPCGGSRKFTTHQPCPKCGSAMTYEEINVQLWSKRPASSGSTGKYPVLSAKIDGVFLDRNGDPWIIDYKFKTANGLLPLAREKLPQPVHELQVQVYTALFRNVFKTSRLRHVKGWRLLYVAFDELGLSNTSGWCEKASRVKHSKSNEVWSWLHDTEIPKAELANDLGHQLIGAFVLSRRSKSQRSKLLDTAVALALASHDCPANACYYGIKESGARDKLQETLVELLG